MRVAMIGSGYVGLVSGACFADFGHEVTCVDKDKGKINSLNAGVVPIYEPGLTELVALNAKAGRLKFTTDLAAAVKDADAVFIAVGTPSRRGDGHADLSFVYDAAREIAAALDGFTVVVTKSTVPVGTGDEVERIIREARPDAEVAVVSNPEFLREGAAIQDFKHPDRIVVGTEDERAKAVMTELYRPLYLNRSPIMFTGRRTAELIKYAANAFLATKITFINEIADSGREGRRRRAGDRARHWPRQSYRRQVPARRSRLWRLVLSQGHAGAAENRAGSRHAAAHRRGRRGGQRQPQAGDGAQGVARASMATSAARPSRCWGSPSSRTPTTCARRRRSR